MGRKIDVGRITSERQKLKDCLREGTQLDTDVDIVQDRPCIPNTVTENEVGLYRLPTARKAVIADMDQLDAFEKKDLGVPSFLEAGPRAEFHFDPHGIRAVIATTGGLAPGLHCVIHAIGSNAIATPTAHVRASQASTTVLRAFVISRTTSSR